MFSFQYESKSEKLANYICGRMLLKCRGLSGAKICKTQCKSCRVRQELSNECLLEIFSVDTAENEPFKVSRWFNSFMYPFASALMTRREGGGLACFGVRTRGYMPLCFPDIFRACPIYLFPVVFPVYFPYTPRILPVYFPHEGNKRREKITGACSLLGGKSFAPAI